MEQLNQRGQSLARALAHAKQISAARDETYAHAEKMHIVGAGRAITAAYEQLRNAAEYTEEHVLLQRAIRRFYRRLFLIRDSGQIAKSGEELAIELTLAGYVPNDSITESTVEDISQLATRYFASYNQLHASRGLTHKEAEEWTLEVLAVEVETLIHDYNKQSAFIQFAYEYYLSSIDMAKLFGGTAPEDSEVALYIAVHRALLKSDFAVIRLALLRRYQQTPESQHYIDVNKHIAALFDSPTTDKLYHVVDRQGAPLRIMRHIIDEQTDSDQLLGRRDTFLSQFETQIHEEYEDANHRINAGIIKSVIFLIITKFLIGIAIEVPYDKIVLGAIAWTPLLINLFFPPVYMLLLRTTLMLPTEANSVRLIEQIDRILYSDDASKQLLRRKTASTFGSAYNVAYAFFFVAVFGTVAYTLWASFHFEILHLVIFFVFLSAASFLGFRLSRIIRELEAVDSHQNGLTLLRDFLYMPFVIVGRWISDKYAKVNVVAMALDMIIELPLKTVLRLVRQWGAFISSKKDQL